MVLDALLDLVLPQECGGCRLPATRWCDSCAQALRSAALEPLGRTAPDPLPVGFPLAAAAGTYDGAVRGALVAHKEQGRLGLVRPLGSALAAAVLALGLPGPLLLVPVPSDPRIVRRRGHDHARRLAGRAALVLRDAGIEARAVPLLGHGRRVVDQAGLSAAGRAANVAGALMAGRAALGRDVVVVDDVRTSGATLAEASRALAAAGARVLGAATVAATVRRPMPPGVT